MSNFYLSLTSFFLSVAMFFTGSLFFDEVTPNPTDPIADGADVRIVSFNLRCTGAGKTSVAYRAPLMTAQLKEIRADSIGVQEANARWMIYLSDNLEGYDYVGVSRQNGKNLGEFSAIFYRSDKYTVADSGTFWLSKTPEKAGSKDWGSANIRICTWAVLENKTTHEKYVHLNTHLDHISSLARENQMKVLLTKVDEYIGKYPIVLTGDFNDYNDSAMYAEVTEVLKDSRLLAPVTTDKGTFHDYGARNPESMIDFIFVSDGVKPLVYHVIDDKVNGVYLSDHYGIYVDLKL